MSSLHSPNDFKDLIVSATGGLCEKMNKLFSLPRKFYEWYAGVFTEGGLFTDQFITMICASGCGTGGAGGGGGIVNPPNPDLPAPTSVNASDNGFSDKVEVTWHPVVTVDPIPGVTQYWVYRSLSTNTDPNEAVRIAIVNSPALIYNDTSALEGVTYNYWVKAYNDHIESAFSTPLDGGYIGTPTTTLAAISDLRCTKGFSIGTVALVFTPPSGATKYDIYRGTVNDSSLATKIWANAIPTLASAHLGVATGDPEFWDNEGELVYYDVHPSSLVKYYYWVIAKKDSPPATSPFSNTDLGWDSGASFPYGSTDFLGRNASRTISPGIKKLYVVLFGGGGGGAGGNGGYGGGGGGGGGVVIEEFVVASGDTLLVEGVPDADNTGRAPAATNGGVGSTVTLKLNGVVIMTADGGGGGLFNPAGGGAGGAGATGSGTATPTIYNSHAGLPAVGSKGGASGYSFGAHRISARSLSIDGNGGDGGPGADPHPADWTTSIGGSGAFGEARIAYGS